MFKGEIGKVYHDGELIVHQGEFGDHMFVMQAGRVEVILERPDREICLSVLERGEIFGEMALFTKEPRSASVRALGEARVLTVDKKGFLRRIHEDPSLAFRILQKMSDQIKKLNQEIARLKECSGA